MDDLTVVAPQELLGADAPVHHEEPDQIPLGQQQ